MSLINPYYPSDKLSPIGKWAFLVSLLFVLSIKAEYRINVGGLLMHPYLILLPFAIVLTKFQLIRVPKSVSIPLLLFFFFFCLGSLQNENPIDEISKVLASILTFLFFASSINSDKDFRWIASGFVLCAVVIAFIAISKSTDSNESRFAGINALEGLGNKNAQSLYTLPGIFFSIYLAFDYYRRKKIVLMLVFGTFTFLISIAIFLSANRSGWVGLAIIILAYLIYLGSNTSSLIIFGLLMITLNFGIKRYSSDIIEHKFEQTVDGYSSDEGRRILIKESLRVGFENPLIGVGKDELHRRMNRAVHLSSFEPKMTDTHNLTGYIFGATGIFSLAIFYTFLIKVAKFRQINIKNSEIDRFRRLLLFFVLLFFIRSFFTREILYSPNFIGGMGIILSYLIFKEQVLFRQFSVIRNR